MAIFSIRSILIKFISSKAISLYTIMHTDLEHKIIIITTYYEIKYMYQLLCKNK